MLQIAAVLSPGVLMVVVASLNWKKHVAKFGPPPAGHHWGTFASFLLWSSGYVLLGWLFPQMLIVLFLLPLLPAILDALTSGLISLGFPTLKSMPWSRKQQARDGFMLASLFVFPLALLLNS